MYSFLHNVQVMQWITFTEVHVKRLVILTDRLGPDILPAFWTKGQILHRERAHLKVPGCSIVLNVLLTRAIIGQRGTLRALAGIPQFQKSYF